MIKKRFIVKNKMYSVTEKKVWILLLIKLNATFYIKT